MYKRPVVDMDTPYETDNPELQPSALIDNMTNDNFRNNSCPQQAARIIPYLETKEELKKGLVVICVSCGYSAKDCEDKNFTISDSDTTDAANLWRLVWKNILADAQQHFKRGKRSMDVHVEGEENKIHGPLGAFDHIVNAMPRSKSFKQYAQMLKHLVSDVASRFSAAENSCDRTFLPASFRQQFAMIGSIEMSERAAKAEDVHFGRIVETSSVNDDISQQVLQKYRDDGSNDRSDELSDGPDVVDDGDDMDDDPRSSKHDEKAKENPSLAVDGSIEDDGSKKRDSSSAGKQPSPACL